MNFALSAFIFAVSLFFVSENWVAITTRQRLIMKKDPTWGKYSILVLYPSKTVLLTRPKVSGSSSRFQGGRGNRFRTRQGQGKDKTGTWQGQDRDKIGTKQGQD